MKSKPRYLQLIENLEKDLQTMPPNVLMPTEHQLAKRFAVSRVTVRRALGFLERAGAVSRQRGQGTIASPSKVTRHVMPYLTLEQDLLNQGLDLETRLLAYERNVSLPENIRTLLGVSADQSVGYLTLLRLVENRIIRFDQRFLPPEFADAFNPSSIGTRPLRDILGEMAGSPVVRGTWEMEIVPAHSEVARALKIIPGVLILQSTVAGYSRTGTPMEAGIVSYRIDRVKFSFAREVQEEGSVLE